MSERSPGAADNALSPILRGVLAAGLIGLLAGFLWGIADVPRYTSSASVVVDPAQGAVSESQLARYAMIGGSAKVATRAAGLLGSDVAGADLLGDVTFTADPASASLRVAATADSPDYATALAEAFSRALVGVGGKDLEPGTAAALPGGASENRSALLWSAIGLLGGLLLGALAALLLRRRRDPATGIGGRDTAAPPPRSRPEPRVVDEGPVLSPEEAFGVPVLARLGDPRELFELRRGELELDPALRPELVALGRDLEIEDEDGPRTLAFVDATPGAGARELSIALAVAAGDLGLRAICVEANLGHPRLAELVGVDPAPGLRDYLGADAGPRQVLRSVRTAGTAEGAPLVCVPAGERRGGPRVSLAGPRFAGLLERLPRVYDLVLLAGPPVGLDDDASTLASEVDAVVLIAGDDGGAAPVAAAADRLAGSRLRAGVLTRPRAAQASGQRRR